jgi:hypothetical protein
MGKSVKKPEKSNDRGQKTKFFLLNHHLKLFMTRSQAYLKGSVVKAVENEKQFRLIPFQRAINLDRLS